VLTMHIVRPTMVSHLDVVVGLCSNDPKDFYNLEDRSILRADQTRESIYYTLRVLLHNCITNCIL